MSTSDLTGGEGEKVCSCCNKPFTTIRRELKLTHPNLFGGVDLLCAECVSRHEKKADEAIKT